MTSYGVGSQLIERERAQLMVLTWILEMMLQLYEKKLKNKFNYLGLKQEENNE